MKSFVYLSIFAVLIFTLSTFSIQDAHATSVTIGDQPSCESISGTWGTSTNTCTVTANQTISSGETWIVNSGVTLTIDLGVTITVDNGGTINNSGTITNTGNINNNGTINNSGTINTNTNYGIILNNGTINNSDTGTITNNNGNTYCLINNGTINNYGIIKNNTNKGIENDNKGTINNYGAINGIGIIYSYGTINNYGTGTINNSGGINNYHFTTDTTNSIATLDGIGTINNYGTITITSAVTNTGTINNYGTGTINNSGGMIYNLSNIYDTGTIINSGTINNRGTIINTYGNITNQCGAVYSGTAPTKGNPIINIICPPKDTTAPIITPTITGTLGNNGWYVRDVTVSWTVTDAESAITTTGCGTSVISSDTIGKTLTCSATSAGGTNSQSVTIKRDTTLPTITGTPTIPNANGWYNTNVDVKFSCTDATSGVVTSFFDVFVTLEGINQSALGTCTDKAGNSASSTISGINLDKTAPTIIAPNNISIISKTSVSPLLGSPTVSDNLDSSPIVTNNAPSSFPSGTTTIVTWTVTDKAGNSASATQQVIIQTLAQAINNLISLGNTLEVNTKVLENASMLLTDNNPNNDSGACGKINAFVNQVNANNTLNPPQKDQLIQLATAIKASIPCSAPDTNPPILVIPNDLTVKATNSTGSSVTFSISATDNMGESIPTSCSHISGNIFPIGKTIVSCTATDDAGNLGKASFTVTVVKPVVTPDEKKAEDAKKDAETKALDDKKSEEKKAADAKKAEDKKASDAKKASDTKALSDKKAADAKKAMADKKAADAKKTAEKKLAEKKAEKVKQAKAKSKK